MLGSALLLGDPFGQGRFSRIRFLSVENTQIMNEQAPDVMPTAIELHRKSRMLEVRFADGAHFDYPCEYLRVVPPGQEADAATELVHGKEDVNITAIEPHGEQGIRLSFDDDGDRVYSWSALYALGRDYADNWQAYLRRLAAAGVKRREGRATDGHGRARIKLLYFIQLAKVAGRDEEDVELPESVTNVDALLDWLRQRGPEWNEAFVAHRLQVTVNKEFAEPFTLIEQGDEVALVPKGK